MCLKWPLKRKYDFYMMPLVTQPRTAIGGEASKCPMLITTLLFEALPLSTMLFHICKDYFGMNEQKLPININSPFPNKNMN